MGTDIAVIAAERMRRELVAANADFYALHAKATEALAAERALADRLAESAQRVVAAGEAYSTEDRWGVYPIGLFEEVAGLRAALAAHTEARK